MRNGGPGTSISPCCRDKELISKENGGVPIEWERGFIKLIDKSLESVERRKRILERLEVSGYGVREPKRNISFDLE